MCRSQRQATSDKPAQGDPSPARGAGNNRPKSGGRDRRPQGEQRGLAAAPAPVPAKQAEATGRWRNNIRRQGTRASQGDQPETGDQFGTFPVRGAARRVQRRTHEVQPDELERQWTMSICVCLEARRACLMAERPSVAVRRVGCTGPTPESTACPERPRPRRARARLGEGIKTLRTGPATLSATENLPRLMCNGRVWPAIKTGAGRPRFAAAAFSRPLSA